MQRIFRWMFEGVIYGSVATVLALALFGGYIHAKFGWSKEKTFRLLAVVYNVDIAEMQAKKMAAAQLDDREDVAYEAVLRERALRTMDQNLREQSVSDGLADLRLLQRDLMDERRRYEMLKESFDAELEKLSEVAKNDAIIEVQQTLETIKPRQAKDHIIRMLPAQFGNGHFDELQDEHRRAVVDVVAIVKAMPLDKRKKILAEFKTEEEAQMLAELLRLIRLGVPESTLIGDARSSLQQFQPN